MSSELGGKKGTRWETHQSVCNIVIDRLPKIVYSEKPGGMISLYMVSIGQKMPRLIIAQDTKLYNGSTSETPVIRELQTFLLGQAICWPHSASKDLDSNVPALSVTMHGKDCTNLKKEAPDIIGRSVRTVAVASAPSRRSLASQTTVLAPPLAMAKIFVWKDVHYSTLQWKA